MKPLHSSRNPKFEVALATWLRLGAAPVFAVLACLSLLYPGVSSLCVSTPSTFAFHDMGPMYLLMSMVHLPAWLTLVGQGLERETANQRISDHDAAA